MATKALNFKLDENEISDMKKVAGVFNMSTTDLVKQALKAYIDELKRDPFYRLTVNVEDAAAEEADEILTEIESMSDDDLSIVSVKHVSM
ncbi:MAG: hypothetical protein IKG91_03100 [Firmicutes bacterium]|nr:hypothetical protein [Bacillota bacterium]